MAGVEDSGADKPRLKGIQGQVGRVEVDPCCRLVGVEVDSWSGWSGRGGFRGR